MSNKRDIQQEDIYTPLSDDELVMLKASRDGEIDRSTLPPHDNSDMAKAKRYVKKNKWGVLFVVITVVLLLAVMGALFFMLIKTLQEQPSSDDFKITLMGTGETYTVPYDDAMIDGVFYLDIIKIAKYADIVVSGNPDNIKLTCDDGSYVRFENGISTATVNGTRVKLEGTATIIKATDETPMQCIIPFSFIEKLFSHPIESDTPGLKTIFSSKTNSVTIGRVKYSETGVELPIGFDVKCFEVADDF